MTTCMPGTYHHTMSKAIPNHNSHELMWLIQWTV